VPIVSFIPAEVRINIATVPPGSLARRTDVKEAHVILKLSPSTIMFLYENDWDKEPSLGSDHGDAQEITEDHLSMPIELLGRMKIE
jgi:hypothetical protein